MRLTYQDLQSIYEEAHRLWLDKAVALEGSRLHATRAHIEAVVNFLNRQGHNIDLSMPKSRLHDAYERTQRRLKA